MKKTLPGWVEGSRVIRGPMASAPGIGPNGAFLLDFKDGRELAIIASTGQGWDHVSVRVADNSAMPTWEEMCKVKDLFFNPHEMAIQYHPRERDYVKFHPLVLHLWRPQHMIMPDPPTYLIGPKGVDWLGGTE